jgi:NDP-sugar pyrophosphorylase family protein
VGHHGHVEEGAHLQGAILWPNTWVDHEARLGAIIAGRHCHFGRSVDVADGAVFGDKSVVTDYSKA